MKRTTPVAMHDDDEADGAGGHACGLSHDIVDEVRSVEVRDDDDADGTNGRTRTRLYRGLETTTTRTAPVAGRESLGKMSRAARSARLR